MILKNRKIWKFMQKKFQFLILISLKILRFNVLLDLLCYVDNNGIKYLTKKSVSSYGSTIDTKVTFLI